MGCCCSKKTNETAVLAKAIEVKRDANKRDVLTPELYFEICHQLTGGNPALGGKVMIAVEETKEAVSTANKRDVLTPELYFEIWHQLTGGNPALLPPQCNPTESDVFSALANLNARCPPEEVIASVRAAFGPNVHF